MIVRSVTSNVRDSRIYRHAFTQRTWTFILVAIPLVPVLTAARDIPGSVDGAAMKNVIQRIEEQRVSHDPPLWTVYATGRVVDSDGSPIAGAAVTLSRGTTFAQVSHPWSFKLDTSELSRIDPASVTFRTLYWQQSIVVQIADFAATNTDRDGRFDFAANFGRAFGETQDVVVTAMDQRGDSLWIGGRLFLGAKREALDVGDLVVQQCANTDVAVRVGGKPYRDARVVLEWPNQHHHEHPASITLRTDHNGHASHWVPLGTVHMRVDDKRADTSSGLNRLLTHATKAFRTRASVVRSVDVGSSGATVEVSLPTSKTVQGIVTEGAGHPVTGVRVTARPAEDREVEAEEVATIDSAETNNDGHYTLSRLALGQHYLLRFTAPRDEGLHTLERELQAADVAVDVRLIRAGPVAVDLRFQSERTPRPSRDYFNLRHYVSRFERRDERTGRFIPETLVEADVRSNGSLRWLQPRPGTWRVIALSGMQTEVTSDAVDIADGSGEIVISVALAPGRTLSGRVIDSSGQPVDRAIVHCDQNGRVHGADEFLDRILAKGTSEATAEDGRFVVTDIPLDATHLSIWKVGSDTLGDATVDVPEGVTNLPDIVLPKREF